MEIKHYLSTFECIEETIHPNVAQYLSTDNKCYAIANLTMNEIYIFVQQLANRFDNFTEALNYAINHEILHLLTNSGNEKYIHSLTVKLLGLHTEYYAAQCTWLNRELINANNEITL